MTTGAESDLDQVSNIARQMVGRWGMSAAIGPVAVLPADGEGPLLPGVAQTSEDTQRLVDAEVRRLADEAHADATDLLRSERAKLEREWARGGDVSTEDLRVALRRYRSFFERLLSACEQPGHGRPGQPRHRGDLRELYRARRSGPVPA